MRQQSIQNLASPGQPQKNMGASKSQLSDSTSHTFHGAIAATEDLYDVLD
jgi:hypothetical protein